MASIWDGLRNLIASPVTIHDADAAENDRDQNDDEVFPAKFWWPEEFWRRPSLGFTMTSKVETIMLLRVLYVQNYAMDSHFKSSR